MALPRLICPTCRVTVHLEKPPFVCRDCGGLLSLPLLPYKGPQDVSAPGIWRFGASLPLSSGVSLGEGDTPLLPARSDRFASDGKSLFFKIETGNPTGSFKDRGSASVTAAAVAHGFDRLVIASTGNAGASVSAYAGRQGLPLTVVVPSWVSEGKLTQIAFHGAALKKVEGGFDDAEREYSGLVDGGAFPAGSDNPFRTEGTKTIAFEIYEQMSGLKPDRIIVPVGTGNLITAMHKGFREIVEAGFLPDLPKIDAVQLASVPPLREQAEMSDSPAIPTSVATGINIARAVLAREAVNAVDETGGSIHVVGEEEVLSARVDLARCEGIGTEPTGAVTVAAYRKAVRDGTVDTGEKVVVTITGHVLKQSVPQ